MMKTAVSFSAIFLYNGPVSNLLLQTKLFKPALRPTLIRRTHLINRLNDSLGIGTEGFAARLSLVCAPAGFGKTTLVSTWLDQFASRDAQSSSSMIAWLSLDNNDNDPVRFLAYVTAALQTAVPNLGKTAEHALQSPQPPPIETILTLLINDISQNDQPIILVMDDYHVITTPAIHQALTFLLEHLPPPLHLLLTSRSDPPLPLSRLRARRQMVEIRADDLRFNLDEAGLFLNQVMGLALSNGEVVALKQRTEGWFAGLQLAALSMQGWDDLSGFIAAFTGSNRFILDYLTDEVLERRPKGTKNFLLQTSILDRFCASLCDAVIGQNQSQAVLELLEQANLFLIPLDDERRWYRYHHLFADVLRSRLQQAFSSPAEEVATPAELHGRASLWFEQEKLIDEAIHYALAAPDIERAASLIERYSPIMLQRSEILRTRTWLENLPLEWIETRPRLILARGWVLTLTGHSQAAKQWLTAPQTVTKLNDPKLSVDIRGQLALLQAAITRSLREGDHGLKFAQQALDFLPEQQRGLRAEAIHIIGVARFRQGNTATASQSFIEAAALGETEGGPYMALNALQDLASIQIRQGRLAQIKKTCEQAMSLADRWGGSTLPAAGMAHIDYGGVLYEQNELAEAEQALTFGIDLLRGSTEQYLLAEGYTILARVRQARGDVAGALAIISQGKTWLDQVQIADVDSGALLALWQARLDLGQGNLRAVVHWTESCGWWSEDTHLGYHQAVTLIRLHIVQSQPQFLGEAEEIIDRLLTAVSAKAWWGHVIELSLLRALLWQTRGDSAASLDSLEKALTLAEPEGFIRLFVDEGEPMARLLRQARQRSIFPDYVDRLLGAFAAEELKQLDIDILPEPLSERELEVLRLVAIGASNKDIADQLFIALSTAKKHVSNMLVKLDTPNRTQAAARARELGLLP